MPFKISKGGSAQLSVQAKKASSTAGSTAKVADITSAADYSKRNTSGMMKEAFSYSTEESAHAEVGINSQKPEIISCFDFLPLYTDDPSGLESAQQSGRLRAQKADDVKKALSSAAILPTVTAELADLQVQSMNLKMEAFKNEMSEFISQNEGSTTLSLERMYDTTQQDVAANVIKYYNVMYQAISAIEMAQDLKSYTIPGGVARTDTTEVEAHSGYFLPIEYSVQESLLRTILPGISMSDFFRDYLYFDSDIFSTFSNTKVYNQLLQDLSSIIQNADPSLLDQPSVQLGRTAALSSRDPFLVDTSISKAFLPIRLSLEKIVNIATAENFSYYGGNPEDYSFQDYMDFISSLPTNSVKRISLLSHFVNRDSVFKSNLSTHREAIPGTTIFSVGGYDTSSFPENEEMAQFVSAGDPTVSEIPRGMEGSIKNILSRAIGSPSGDCFEYSGKTGASAVSVLKSTRSSHTGDASTVLPFESTDKISPEKRYQSGLSFFTKNISDAHEDSGSSATMESFLASMVSPFHYFSTGVRNYTASIPWGVNRLLYGSPDDTPTTNLVFLKSLLSELSSYFEERPTTGLDAAQLAILSMADDPDVGYRLARFMMNYKMHHASPVGYSYPTLSPISSAPVDEIGSVPSSASDPSSSQYRFYHDNVLDYISEVGARDRDLIDSMVDLANVVHNKATLLSTEINVPGYSSTGLIDSDSTFTSFIINTYEKYKEYTGTIETFPTITQGSTVGEGLTSGWGMALMLALNDNECLFGRICTAVDNFIDETHGLAQAGTTSYTSVLQQSTFQFRHIHQAMIATEICKEIINEYMPVKIANTGYERETQLPYGVDGYGFLGQEHTTTYFLNRIRIDVFTSHIDSLVSAISSIPTYTGGGMVSSDPPIGGESEITAEYSETIRRSIFDIMGNLMNQDTAISNIARVLRVVGYSFDAAREKLNQAAGLLAGYISSYPQMGVDVDVTLTNTAARALFQSIRRDTSNHTLSLLSPEQIQTMSAMYYSLSNSGDYNTLFPGGKLLSPGDCMITKRILQQSPFLGAPGKKRKILTIGLPAKIIEELRLQLDFNGISEFGKEYFTGHLEDGTNAESMFGLGGSAILSRYSLVKVKVYKRNLQKDFSAYKPKTFLFDPGLFILPFQNEIGRSVPTSGLLEISKRVAFSKLSIIHEDGSLNLEPGTGALIKLGSDLALSTHAKSVYPWAFIETDDGAGSGVTDMGHNESIEGVGGTAQSEEMIKALITNHLVNYGLRNYLKLVSDIDVNEHVFQFKNKGFDSFPDPLTSDIYSGFVDFLSSRQKVGDARSAKDIDYLRKLCEISYPFARENYRDRVVNAMSFDRVFNVLIDEDSFEEYQLSDDSSSTGGSKTSSATSGGGVIDANPYWVDFSAEQATAPIFSYNSGLNASYNDYFVTVELYQPVQYAPDEEYDYTDDSDTGDASLEESLDGGMLGEDSGTIETTPIEMMPPDAIGEIYAQDPDLLKSQVGDMIEKIQPMLDNSAYKSDEVQEMFDRSVVCPKFYGSIAEETETFLNNQVDMKEMLDKMLDDITGGLIDMSPSDMIKEIQNQALENLDVTDSFRTKELEDFTTGTGLFQPGSLVESSIGETISTDTMLRGFETQIGAAFSSGIDSISGVDSEIFNTGLSSGLAGMDISSQIAAYTPESSLSTTQLSYGISYETMTSRAGLSSMGSAISAGAGASSIESNLSMFEFHTSYGAGYQTQTTNLTGLF